MNWYKSNLYNHTSVNFIILTCRETQLWAWIFLCLPFLSGFFVGRYHLHLKYTPKQLVSEISMYLHVIMYAYVHAYVGHSMFIHSFPPYAPKNLFTDSQDRTIISFLRDEVEFICNSDCLLSFWIINDLYYYRTNPLPEGYVFHYPSTLIVDTIAASVNRTTYQCVACNTLSSTLTLHL